MNFPDDQGRFSIDSSGGPHVTKISPIVASSALLCCEPSLRISLVARLSFQKHQFSSEEFVGHTVVTHRTK